MTSNLWVLNLALLASLAVGPSELVVFPGNRSAASPDGQYVIQWREPDDEVPQHTLYLLNTHTGTRTEWFRFNRHVEVLWAPDSRAVAVNDFLASNAATCWIALLEDGDVVMDDLGARLIGNEEMGQGLRGNDHVYVLARSWLRGSTGLRIVVAAYGDRDPDGFLDTLEYNLGDGFQLMNHGSLDPQTMSELLTPLSR